MADVGSLLADIALLVLALAAVGFVLLFWFRWDDAVRLVKKVKYGKAEVEFAPGQSQEIRDEILTPKSEDVKGSTNQEENRDETADQLEPQRDAVGEELSGSSQVGEETALSRAIELAENGEYEEALEVGREASREEGAPTNEVGITAFLRAVALENGVQIALQDLERSHEDHPDNPEVADFYMRGLYV